MVDGGVSGGWGGGGGVREMVENANVLFHRVRYSRPAQWIFTILQKDLLKTLETL